MEKRADINQTDKRHGWSPLFYAALNVHEAFVKALLDNSKCEPNIYSRDGPNYHTALEAAAHQGHAKIVRILLERGAKVDFDDASLVFHTPLQAAAESGDLETVRIILEKIPLDKAGGRFHTALQAAEHSGNSHIVQLLLDTYAAGASISGYHLASLRSSSALALLLLQKVAHVNLEGGEHCTALHAGAASGCPLTVDILLKYVADIITLVNTTAPLTAARMGNFEILERLLTVPRVNTRLNMTDVDGRSLLSWVATAGRLETVKKIKTFTDAPREGLDKRSPWCLMACQRDSDGSTPLTRAAETGAADVVRFILDNSDVDVNTEDNEGLTPLHKAAMNGHMDVAVSLVAPLTRPRSSEPYNVTGDTPVGVRIRPPRASTRADVEHLDNGGNTPLALARVRGNVDMISLLETASRETNKTTQQFYEMLKRVKDDGVRGLSSYDVINERRKRVDVAGNGSWFGRFRKWVTRR